MKDNKAAVAWQKWVDVQLGDWRDVSHSESFYAGYEEAEGELTELSEKLAAVREALNDVIDPMRYLARLAEKDGAVLNGLAHQIANDRQTTIDIARKALAIIDGKEGE